MSMVNADCSHGNGWASRRHGITFTITKSNNKDKYNLGKNPMDEAK